MLNALIVPAGIPGEVDKVIPDSKPGSLESSSVFGSPIQCLYYEATLHNTIVITNHKSGT